MGRVAAQEQFRELLRLLRPALAERGFVRQGATFTRHYCDNWLVVNVQRSSTSTAAAVRFTVNLGIVSCRLLVFYASPRADSFPREYDCHWRQRLGFLTPRRNDKWWTVDADTDLAALRDELASDLCERAFPVLEEFACDTALRDLWLSGQSPGVTKLGRLLYLSVLLREIGPQNELPLIVEELRRQSAGRPTAAMVATHLEALGLIAPGANAGDAAAP